MLVDILQRQSYRVLQSSHDPLTVTCETRLHVASSRCIAIFTMSHNVYLLTVVCVCVPMSEQCQIDILTVTLARSHLCNRMVRAYAMKNIACNSFRSFMILA